MATLGNRTTHPVMISGLAGTSPGRTTSPYLPCFAQRAFHTRLVSGNGPPRPVLLPIMIAELVFACWETIAWERG